MMLIYVPKLTNRIGYTLNLIFQSILHIPFEITLDQDYYTSFEGCKLCYAKQKIGDGLYIKQSNLLSQTYKCRHTKTCPSFLKHTEKI